MNFCGEASLRRQQRGHQSKPWGRGFFLFRPFTYQETHLSPVVLGNLIVWRARPPPHVEVARSSLSVESDLSALAFRESTHTHTHSQHRQYATCLSKNTLTHKLRVKRRVRPLDSDNTWIQTAGLMRSDVASGVWNSAFSIDSLNYLQCVLQYWGQAGHPTPAAKAVP